MIDITISLKGNEMLVGGKLVHNTVMAALEKSIALLPSDQEISVNLSAVTGCDSSSLAFLTALMREGKKRRTQLHFSHIPAEMDQIGRVSGLDNVLPITKR